METKYIDIPEWDKTFALSDKVTHKKVSFTNRYGIRLVGDLYIPKNHTGKLPAIAVCGPYGAVKDRHRAFMPRPLPNVVSSLLLSTRHSAEKAADSPVTYHRGKSTPRITVRR